MVSGVQTTGLICVEPGLGLQSPKHRHMHGKESFKKLYQRLTSRTGTSVHNNNDMVRIGAFISIPKNASKSVLQILKLGPNRDLETTDSLVIYENHQRGSVLSRRWNLDPIFVFCFSRNPYDRCVSWFQFHRHLKPYKGLTFDSWVKEGLPHHFEVQNQTDYVRESLSPLLQWNYVEGCHVDFIGKLESFENDMQVVVHRLNEKCGSLEIPHRFYFSDVRTNISQRKQDYESYYTKETKAVVQNLLRKDFEYFEYEM